MKHLCIYHKNCTDGFAAALAVKTKMDQENIDQEDREFLPAHYGDEAPDVHGKNVIIVDFSYSRETLIRMHEEAENLVVIDHHKTAQEALEGLSFCHFDMAHSGAMLTWKYFFPNDLNRFELPPGGVSEHLIPELIHYIEDRDLWKWELYKSKEVSAALQALPMTFEYWEPYLNENNIDSLIMQGETILRYQKHQIDKITSSNLPMVHFCGYRVPCINTTTLISEIGNAISKGHAFAMMYFDTKDKRIYSLRSQKEGADVSTIAKQFGGGGHPQAAGFSIEWHQMLANKYAINENRLTLSIESHPDEASKLMQRKDEKATYTSQVMNIGDFHRLPEYDG